MNLEPWDSAVRAYAKWLDKQSPAALKDWCRRIDDKNQEGQLQGALGEVCTWEFLAARVAEIRLCNLQNQRIPDLKCVAENGAEFIVETTNLTTESVTRATGLQDRLSSEQGFTHYSPLTRLVLTKAKNKASQVSDVDVPSLVFVTTFHGQASGVCIDSHHMEALLVGTPMITCQFDPEKGEAVGEPYESTKQRDSLFSKIKKNSLKDSCPLAPLRQSISGVVVSGFGLCPPQCNVIGVLHPDPVRPFDVNCLPDVRFGRLANWPPKDNKLSVEWQRADGSACDDESEMKRHRDEAAERLRINGCGDLLDLFDAAAHLGEQ